MKYRMLGNTGLQVSVLSYGFWASFGSKGDAKGDAGLAAAKECLSVARAAGVNLFDNAEAYGKPMGEAERIMGEAMAQLRAEEPALWRRSDVLVSTKVFWGGRGVNESGLSLKHCREALAASLRRLQLEYVDLVFCHRPDPLTPTHTVVRAMTDLVRGGGATAWGTSEWSAQQLTEAFWIARAEGLEPPQFEQPQYHMFHRRRFEAEYQPLYAAPYRLGTTVWSPLAGGLLTGKYGGGGGEEGRSGEAGGVVVPPGSRLADPAFAWLRARLEEWREDGKLAAVGALAEFARAELGCSVAQLAVAWCLKNENVSTVLLGATKPEQLRETLAALDVAPRLTAEHMSRLDVLLGSKPPPYEGYGGHGARKLSKL